MFEVSLSGLAQLGIQASGGLAVLAFALTVWHLIHYPNCCSCCIVEHCHHKKGANVHPTNGFLRHAVITAMRMLSTVFLGVGIIPVFAITVLVWVVCKALQMIGFFKPKPAMYEMTEKQIKEGGRNIAIIGAGPSALIVAKECIDMGHTVTLFERKKVIGGAFNAYYKARMTSSSWITAFTHLPMHKSPHGEYLLLVEYLEYLKEFARTFNLYERIKFNTEVVRCDGTIEKNGKVFWEIDTKPADDLETGKVTSYTFDRLIVCCGIAQKGKKMSFEIEEGAEDRIAHSDTYDVDPNTWKKFANKKVIIIGAGESAADVGYFIAKENAEVIFLQRGCSKSYYIPRFSFGRPTDAVLVRDMWKAAAFKSLLIPITHLEYLEERPCDNSAVLDAVHDFQRVDMIKGARSIFTFTCKNENMFKALLELGSKHQVGEIAKVSKDGLVTLKDGSTIENVDKIIAAVGFKPDLTLLRVNGERIYTPKDFCPRKLLWHIFDPNVGDAVAFVGYLRPTLGGLPPLSEMASRLVALMFNKNSGLKLPEKEEAFKIRDRHNKFDMYCVGERRFHDFGILVEFTSTMERLARVIGCVPDSFQLFLNDPLLWHALWYRTVSAKQYRVHGPGKFEYDRIRKMLISGWMQAPHVQLGITMSAVIWSALKLFGVDTGPEML